ncbi:MAG: ribosome maturation factor RimP [Bacteroidetes bacterium]|nr:ribosome maturation factor RimP [Bacteroidota bacterium]MDA1269009.1 ribosome maturation factor RimP [Bacteroidota bacterium]
MSDLKHVILDLVEKHLPDATHFIVEVKIERVVDKTKILILVDADQGMTIASCASLSRALAGEMETNAILEEAYTLEVSSPGLDYPLTEKRQYLKNVGRSLKAYLLTGEEVLGKLKEVEEQGIKLMVTKKEKGKKSVEEERSISSNEIKKSIVQVSFN